MTRPMMLPDYWLTRPNMARDDDAEKAFDELLTTALSSGSCPDIPYALPWPKWQFLCHVADHHQIALHGSANPDITLFEPRQSNDVGDFGNQKAVYAASDGLWAMFFAIVDRDRFSLSVANACVRLVDEKGAIHGPFYVFSVSRSALPLKPWRSGTVYLLPRESFVNQPSMTFGTSQVQIAQLASYAPVPPLAKLAVTPTDFPFLRQIRGHDDERLAEYATAMQTGAAWPDDG